MAHNKTLTELKWFKWALWGPIGVAVVVAIVIAYFTSEDLQVCFTSTCVNEAISRLKLPIAIASLAFPLVALVASRHRIAQTARQIEVMETKNFFENTLKHHEFESVAKKMISFLCRKIAQCAKSFFIWVLKGSQQLHPSLFQLRSFWVVAGLPIIIALIVWFCIFKSIGYPDLAATYDGFNQAYEYFKIPLWIAALSLPLAGFYATNHRSVETAKQITIASKQMDMTSQKNNFENSIKHREYFIGQLKLIEERNYIEFEDYHRLYERIFLGNNLSNFSPWADHNFESDSYILKRAFAFIYIESGLSSSSIYNPIRLLNIKKYYCMDVEVLEKLVKVVDENRYDGIEIEGLDGVEADVAILYTLSSIAKVLNEIVSISMSPNLSVDMDEYKNKVRDNILVLHDSITQRIGGSPDYAKTEITKQGLLWMEYLRQIKEQTTA